MLPIRRRVRQELQTPQRGRNVGPGGSIGSRIPGLRQEVSNDFADQQRAYRAGLENNRIYDDMALRARERGVSLEKAPDELQEMLDRTDLPKAERKKIESR